MNGNFFIGSRCIGIKLHWKFQNRIQELLGSQGPNGSNLSGLLSRMFAKISFPPVFLSSFC